MTAAPVQSGRPFLARPTQIDFIAHHEMQFQAGAAVCSALSTWHDCRVLIGQDQRPSGARAVVMLDHSAFQSAVNRTCYDYLVHMSHDLADLHVYRSEHDSLSKYDLILTPGEPHAAAARDAMGSLVPVFPIGWPKAGASHASHRPPPSGPLRIIYAPSFIGNAEWRALLPALISSGHSVIVKNHVYYNFEAGDAPPRGAEASYGDHIRELLEMEEFVRSSAAPNLVYVDRRSNICDLFPSANVLITDASSAALEFLAFGVAIETGRNGPATEDTAPVCSLMAPQVKYVRMRQLLGLLLRPADFGEMVDRAWREMTTNTHSFIYDPPLPSADYAASLIDMGLFLRQHDYRPLPNVEKRQAGAGAVGRLKQLARSLLKPDL